MVLVGLLYQQRSENLEKAMRSGNTLTSPPKSEYPAFLKNE